MKKFSLVSCEEFQQVVPGFIEPVQLADIPNIVKIISDTSSLSSVIILLSHMVFLDSEGSALEDATEEEVEILQEELPNFADLCAVYVEEEIELLVRGLLDEELVDTFLV